MSHSNFTGSRVRSQRLTEHLRDQAAQMFEHAKTAPPAYGRVIAPGERFYFLSKPHWFDNGWHFLVTRCPFCGKQHYHGWPPPDDPLQYGGEGSTRESHCSPGGRYRLEIMGKDIDEDARKLERRRTK